MVSLTEIFLVTYSILYGIMLNGCLDLNLFPFGKIWVNPKAKARILVSVVLINLVPALIFAVAFVFLEGIMKTPNVVNVFGAFLSSMIVFSPYRFLQSCIVYRPALFYLDSEKKTIFSRVPLESQSPNGHIFGTGLYIVLGGIGFLLLHI